MIGIFTSFVGKSLDEIETTICNLNITRFQFHLFKTICTMHVLFNKDCPQVNSCWTAGLTPQ